MSAREAHVVAQAKVNLLLRVLGRDLSGYHQIETVFLRLELGDDVRVRCGGTSRALTCDESGIPIKGLLGAPTANLAYRAAVAFAEAAGWPRGFTIDIRKRIPVGGGLGGGSADAGAVLRILNQIAPSPLTEDRLRRVAFGLGADVPFLAAEYPMAIAWGRGERLHEVAPLPTRDVALAFPPVSVSAREAYEWLDADRSGDLPLDPTIQGEMLQTWERVAEVMRNDLEAPVIARHPQIGSVRRRMAAESRLTLMSGSGSTVFGVFDAPRPLAFGADASVSWTRTAARVVPVERVG